MSAVRVGFTESVLMVLAALTLAGPAGRATAQTQTPDATCSADSLNLLSPAMLDLRLDTVGKPGLTISWPNLDQTAATCFSLTDTAGLGFEVALSGSFNDKVDRDFVFSTPDSGVIGEAGPKNIKVTWQSQGSSSNGILAGEINLANNGGFWSYDSSGGSPAWRQVNNGLPMTWPRTNVVAMDRGTGDFMVAAFTKGVALESPSTGLYAYNGTNWARLAADLFNEDLPITAVAISQQSNDRFAVGTDGGGMFVTADGGATFTQWSANLDPSQSSAGVNFVVTALNWESDRLLVFLANWGLFLSADGGTSFTRSPITVPSNLDLPAPTPIMPTIRDFAVDPTNSQRIVAGLDFHGAYETTDAGASWHDLYGDLVVPVPGDPGRWSNTGVSVLIDASDPQVIVMGVEQRGLFRTSDGGLTWSEVGAALQPSDVATVSRIALSGRPGSPGQILALEDGWLLLQSLDSGATWTEFAAQPALPTGLFVVPRRDDSGDFMIGTNGGGIYQANSALPLAETYSTTTSAELRNLDLGLNISFTGGVAVPDDAFRVVAQTFQGWAVWRGAAFRPNEMKLIGLYDRVNPEDCFEGYCGDNSLEIVPLCFAAKRAACFDLSDPDTLRFFDQEVYNGFSYVYSVTSFDYGNTALTTPQNNTREMLFSPRWADDDPLSIFSGPGNRTRFDVNRGVAAPVHDEEIYAFPNPVRLGAGIPRGEGSLVTFTNLPAGSRVRVFTTAGDDVINLGPDNQVGGQIYWRTVNRSGADVAAGVYLYKVEMPQREDYWGRIVVIR